MNQPIDFYKSQIQNYTAQLKQLRRKSIWISASRLLSFLLIAILIYFFYKESKVLILIVLAGIPLFLFLVSKSENIKQLIHIAKEYILINENELKVLQGDYTFLDSGSEFINPEHHFSYDIDLFGKASFFQYINRSIKQSAKVFLSNLLISNDVNDIEERQDAIKELSEKSHWRQKFMITSRLDSSKYHPDQIVNWVQYYQSFTKKFMYHLVWAFSILSIIVILVYYFKFVNAYVLLFWALLGLGIVGKYAKKTQKLFAEIEQIKPSLAAYKSLIDLIENEKFTTGLLQKKQQELVDSQTHISQNISAFLSISKRIEFTNNLIIKFIGDAFFLYDLLMAYQMERWIAKHKDEMNSWYAITDFFESYSNLGNFAFNHPSYIFPKINDQNDIIKSSGLGHPLLDSNKRIDNDFDIKKHSFFIITGANMAGKSTFLRTVSLNIVMANSGLPVCAQNFDYHPIKLITSMRTSDSLSKDESYFFAELKRLKFMVDQMNKDEYFIVLDEILKGTNSIDKAMGSQKFVEKLVHSKSTGIIATHDLSLCKLEDDFKQIKNYFFDAAIIDDELFFDYKLKTGICQNMNASFLLKKMNII